MNEKPYLSSVCWLPSTSENRIAARMLKTRNANARVSHSNAVSIHGAERAGRERWGSLITVAAVAVSDASSAMGMLRDSRILGERSWPQTRTEATRAASVCDQGLEGSQRQ